jgi:RNA polymerase sigma-70 factor (ECF subfamily)
VGQAAGESGEPVRDLRTSDAFGTWVAPHWAAMAALAARSPNDPDDILQDALAAAWRKRAQFDPARGSARNWLLAITADQRWKAGRAAARLLAHRTAASSDEVVAAQHDPDSTHLDVERALRRLPARQRLAVDLYYFLGLSVADAAAVMRCSDGTVKSTLSDARSRLRRLLGEDYL